MGKVEKLHKEKNCFTNIGSLEIITPSEWLAGLVKKSYLKDYKVTTIHNGVNTNIFRNLESDIRIKFGLNGYKVILGVSPIWEKRKGLDDFI